MFRLAPRQVVVIVPRSPTDPNLAALAHDLGSARMDELLLATLRDAIAAAVRVDGATISVVAPSPDQVSHLRHLLPAGVEFASPAEPLDRGRLARFGLAAHADQGFERIVVVDGAVLRLTSRVVGTGLGALASADAVVGNSSYGVAYAFGLLGRHASRFIHSDELLFDADRPPTELLSQLRAMRLDTRRLDPCPTLDEFTSLNELQCGVFGAPGLGRHLAAFLSRLPMAERTMLDQHRPM